LINGDDLLYRDIGPGGLSDGVQFHGSNVGLRLNTEKTMKDAEMGEINSTLFLAGVKQKKTNCRALYMGDDEADVIGFSDRSTVTDGGFLSCVRRNLTQLQRQDIKIPGTIGYRRFNLLLRDPTIRRALRFRARREQPTNLFPVVTVPDGYSLTREEEVAAVARRVAKYRS
jgi:hypothetical protein